MKSVGRTIGKKAAKATAKHSVHGLSDKARRKPLRTTSLLGAGALAGLVIGWVTGRRTVHRPAV